jgi:transcriptional regulator with XRE-family HTH domain
VDLRKVLSSNVRRLRLEQGLSQSELARRIKMDRPYLNRLEKGAIYPGLKNIGSIAAGLNVEPADLLKLPPQRPGRDI